LSGKYWHQTLEAVAALEPEAIEELYAVLVDWGVPKDMDLGVTAGLSGRRGHAVLLLRQ
jgi:hypothetical protein